MADFNLVPIVNIDSENFKELWPSLLLSIKSSSFIAIDLELSGLGERKLLSSKSIEDRYKAIRNVAKTRSILTFGISCFQQNETNNDAKSMGDESIQMDFNITYSVQTYNLYALCSEEYIVEQISLKFLVDHGFDFNLQYSRGLPYFRGSDKIDILAEEIDNCLRKLFSEIVVSCVPIVLHNAMVDLIFMYESFYAPLPQEMDSFLSALTELFPQGIYDTKVWSEFQSHMKASYLEYIFRKCQRENSLNIGQGKVELSFLDYFGNSFEEYVSFIPCGLRDKPCTWDIGKNNICFTFAHHGWCPNGNHCEFSHDIDMILDSGLNMISLKKEKCKKVKKNKTILSDSISKKQEQISNIALDTNLLVIEENTIIPSLNLRETLDIFNSKIICTPKVTLKDVQTETFQNEKETLDSINRIGGHSAGFDAFMTGYVFATIISNSKTLSSSVENYTTNLLNSFDLLSEFKNKIYLSGKDFALQIAKSNFSKKSKFHLEKLKKLKFEKK